MISQSLLYSKGIICYALARCLCAVVLLLKTVADQLKTLHSFSIQCIAEVFTPPTKLFHT